jgi:hypothetical protein
MAGQLEFNLRAMLCRQLAMREPENRILWMAEAENWTRLSKEKRRGSTEDKVSSDIAASLREQSVRFFSTQA